MTMSGNKGKGNSGGRAIWVAGLVFVLFIQTLTSVASAMEPAAKFFVKETGFYRVTKTQLAAVFSMTESNVANTSFSVQNVGQLVPSVRQNGDVVFYGQRFATTFTDENVYWIKPGVPGVVETQAVTAGTTPYNTSYPVVKRTEQQAIFRADIIREDGQENEDPIYWRLISSGLSTSNFTTTVTLDNVAPSTGGSLKVRVKGATDIAGRYYHRCRILLNNTLIGEFTFDGLNTAEATFTVPTGLWVSGNNSLRIQSNPPPGTTFDSFYFDYIDAGYQRTYVVQTNRLNMAVSSGSTEVSSLNNSNIICWNVENPWNPRQLSGGQIVQAGTNWKYNFSTTLTGRYAVVAVGSEMAPLRMKAGSLVNLRAADWQVDHLTIAETGLVASAQAIKTYRASQGLKAEVVSVDDIYDNFNFGIRDPRAIKNFISYAYRNWAVSPRYVFLLGDGSLDYKNALGANDSGIPSFPIVVANGMYASDTFYGDVDDDGSMDIAVGRLPVNAQSNVTDYITKLANYELGGGWKTNTLITTDQSDYAGNFYSDGNDLQQYITDRAVARADIDVIGVTPTRESLIAEVNKGKEVSLYIGHGTPNQLSLQSILLTSDAVTFTNSTAPTTFVMIGCLVGSFANPAFTSIGEGLIKAKGGASSMIAAATLISAADGKVLTEEFLDSIYADGVDRVGDAWIRGKSKLTEAGRHNAYKAFQLLGDPGMAIRDFNAPRAGETNGPTRGSYQEWQNWAFPPSLKDLGFPINENDDPDGDKVSNWSEYMAGTDPMDPSAFLEIIDIRRQSGNQKLVRWPSVAGRSYRLEYATNVKGPYSAIDVNIPSTAPYNDHSFPQDGVAYIYRVVVE